MSYSSRTSKGILSFRNPAASETHTVALGELINNAVTIYKNSNLSYSLYVCNNDLNLYVVDINSRKLSLNRKINCELNTALNNVVRCPMSEKVLTVTGDSSSVFLVDPTSSNSSARIATLNTHHDSGFGVSYHPNGTTFAVSFQDGACLLYDIRNLPTKQSNGSSSTYSYAASPTSSSSGALFEFKSTRAGHPNGAFRCCKFSQTGINDMLVISEHVGRVHLIDLNKCNSSSNDQSHGNQGHQVMVLPYALDQFGSFEKQKLTRTKGKGEEETDFHFKIPVYGDDEDETGESSGFSVPLVYDYDYLVNSYPNLFKDYSYSPIDTNEYADNGGAFKFHQNPDQWVPFGHNQTNLTSISEDFDYYNESSPRSNSTLGEPFPCHSHISANANHINGEINLAGIDWLGEKLLIACEDGGILSWDMNTKGRMSNGGFAYV